MLEDIPLINFNENTKIYGKCRTKNELEDVIGIIKKIQFDLDTLRVLMMNFASKKQISSDNYINNIVYDRFYFLTGTEDNYIDIFKKYEIKKENYNISTNHIRSYFDFQCDEKYINNYISALINHFFFITKNKEIFKDISRKFTKNFNQFEIVSLSSIHSFSSEKNKLVTLKFYPFISKWPFNEIINITIATKNKEKFKIESIQQSRVFNCFEEIEQFIKKEFFDQLERKNVYIWEFIVESSFIEKNDDILNAYLGEAFKQSGWKNVYCNILLKKIEFSNKVLDLKWNPEFDVFCQNDNEMLIIEIKRRNIESSNQESVERDDILRFIAKCFIIREILKDTTIYMLYITSGNVNENFDFIKHINNFYIIHKDSLLSEIGKKIPFYNPFEKI